MIAVMSLAACHPQPSEKNDYPQPEHMRVLSAESVGRSFSAGNLIYNGDFSIWHSGALAPENFLPPRDSKISELRRIEPRGGPGRHTADQWWNDSDADASYLNLFHTIAPGIQADRQYTVFIDAISLYDATASISVLALNEQHEAVGVWPELITIQAGDPLRRSYSRTIKVNHNGSLAVMSHTNTNTTYRARINWLEWRLTEAAPDADDVILPTAM